MMTPMAELRKALGLTQVALAKMLDCDHSTISLAESGRPLGAIMTRRIMDRYRGEMTRLGLDAEDLLRGEIRADRPVGLAAQESLATGDSGASEEAI